MAPRDCLSEMPPGSRKRIYSTPGTQSPNASLEVDDVSPVAEPTSPFQSDSEDEDSRPKKNGRKPTVGLEVAKRLKEGTKIGGLIIHPDRFAVVGPSEKLFKMEIGVITRSLAPFRVLHWKLMDDNMKEPLFSRVASEFEIDLSDPHVKEVVDAAMAKSFRRYKHRCYEHYKKFTDPEVAKKNKPKAGISMLDWLALCEHFESDKFKLASDANTKNRGNVEVNHRSGSKSFIQRVYEMENSEDPQTKPAELKVYHDIHQKDGNWIHPQAEEKYEKMNNLLENGENLTGKQIVEKVCMKPKSSYARGLGYGYKSSSSRRVTTQPCYEDNTRAQLREALTEIESQREMIESQQNVIDEMKLSQEKFMNKFQKLMRKKRKKKSTFLKLRA